MGYIKEPEGVDLVINGGPLSSEDAQKVSAIILRYKKMHNMQVAMSVLPAVRVRSCRKKELEFA